MRRWSVVFSIAVAVVCAAAAVSAQTGSLDGHVTDADTGDDLIGVDVVLVGSGKAMQSDIDGKFAFAGLAAGTYSLKVNYLGYAPQDVKSIQVNAGKATTVNIRLEAAEAFATEDVVVTADRIRTTETAVLAERKEAAVVGDAISAAQVQKSPDGTSGDALKRVTGLTVVDGQYVFVRGVTDRYNTTELNGVGVTSTDTDKDRKSFSFDLVPANLLANTTVIKTATPDMPGDFSGGLVRVNTLEFPDQATTNFSLSMGRSEGTTGKTGYVTRVKGGHDWLADDDGTRDFPRDLPRSTSQEMNELGRTLKNNWGVKTRTTPPKYSFSLSHGNRFDVVGDQVGLLAAVSYRNGYDQGPFHEERGGPETDTVVSDGDEYEADMQWAGILNLNWKFNDDHRLGIKNSYNRNANETVVFSRGLDASKRWKRQSEEWEENSLLLSELDGHHRLSLIRPLEVDWRAYYNASDAAEPDLRYIEYNTDDPEFPIMDENLRNWSWLNEIRRGSDVDVSVPLSEEAGAGKVKLGTSIFTRKRNYDVEAWSAVPEDLAYTPSWLPPDSIFVPELFGANEGWNLVAASTYSGKYEGRHDVNAYYLMLDLPFTVRELDFRVAGGVRLEDSAQQVVARVADDEPGVTRESRISTADYLPSLNLNYLAAEKINLRFAYYKSVNRPEFREMAAVRYYDFHNFQTVFGNPDLKRALIDNLDARVEYFPTVGEVLAVSVFDKYFTDAIEEATRPNATRPALTWYNAPKGRNYGFELEARKNLGFLAERLAGFSVGGNYTRVWSEVDFADSRAVFGPNGENLGQESFTNTRPMQGQAPWSLNLSAGWEQPAWGTSITLLYNKIGRRLATVGLKRVNDIFEEPRDVVDIAATQRLTSVLKLKATVKDLQGHDITKSRGPSEAPYSVHAGGTEYSLAMSASF